MASAVRSKTRAIDTRLRAAQRERSRKGAHDVSSSIERVCRESRKLTLLSTQVHLQDDLEMGKTMVLRKGLRGGQVMRKSRDSASNGSLY
jgi:hypothetical protein